MNSEIPVFQRSLVVVIWVTSLTETHLQRLSRNVTREICEYFGQIRLQYHIVDNRLLGFDVNSKQWGVIRRLTSDLGEVYRTSYAFVVISPSVFFLCGGLSCPDKRCAHIITIDGVVLALQKMIFGRYAHASTYIQAANLVYVFGGANSGRLQSVESFSLGTQQWAAGPDLQRARAGINACHYTALVYLCAGDIDGSIEAFDWRQMTTTLLPLRLPVSHNCVTVVQGEEWVSITDEKACVWTLDGRIEVMKREGGRIATVCPPLLAGGVIYFTSTGVVSAVDYLTTCELGRWSYLIGWKG